MTRGIWWPMLLESKSEVVVSKWWDETAWRSGEDMARDMARALLALNDRLTLAEEDRVTTAAAVYSLRGQAIALEGELDARNAGPISKLCLEAEELRTDILAALTHRGVDPELAGVDDLTRMPMWDGPDLTTIDRSYQLVNYPDVEALRAIELPRFVMSSHPPAVPAEPAEVNRPVPIPGTDDGARAAPVVGGGFLYNGVREGAEERMRADLARIPQIEPEGIDAMIRLAHESGGVTMSFETSDVDDSEDNDPTGPHQ